MEKGPGRLISSLLGSGGNPLSSPSSLHQNVRAGLASRPYANQHPDTSPLLAGPPPSQPCTRQRKLERSASSPPSFGELVCSDRGPAGCRRWGRRDVGDMEQESQKPELSPQTSRNQLPHPHPSPREPTGNRKCLLPGLAGGDREREGPQHSALAAP